MSERYEKLFALTDSLYGEGAPVLIAAGVLLWDNKTGQALVQLKLHNIGRKVIREADVTVFPLDEAGNPIGASVCHSYKEQNVAGNGDFGQKSAIVLPDAATASFTARVDTVEFTDGSCWTGSTAWEGLPLPQSLDSLNDPELEKQFRLQYGESSRFLPTKVKDLRYCTCGAVNRGEETVCCACGKPLLSFGENELAELNEKKEARLAAEREEAEQRSLAEEAERKAAAFREEQARQEAEALRQEKEKARRARRKKTGRLIKKTLLILLAAVLVISLTFVVVTKYVLPEVRRNQAYREAEYWFDSGAYEDAQIAFLELGDYKDAPERALESRYQAARVCCDNGDYPSAIAIWEDLGGYSDSAERAAQALLDWKEGDYQSALAQKEAGAYIAASESFAQLGDYKDSQEQSEECVELQLEADYTAAADAFSRGEYQTAMEQFAKLGDYKDAAEQYVLSAYQGGLALLESGSYREAASLLKKAGDYEDASERVTEAVYRYGCQLLEAGNYTSALDEFKNCSGYADTSKKVLEAKFGYVNANPDPENKTTYSYIKELVEAKYSGAKKVYNELYGWKVEVIAFNNNPYSHENQTSVSKYQYMCVHFKVTGGEPGASTNIRTTITLPTGTTSIPHPGIKSGYVGYSYVWYYNPSAGPTGTLTFRAYDENNKLLLTDSVPITG